MTTTRNRWLYAAGAAVACAAVLVTANVALAARNAVPAGSARPAASAAPSAPPAAGPATGAPSSAIIATGIKAARGEWVLYAKPVTLEHNPGITFGVMLGVRTGDGEPVDAVMANEVEGPDSAPGFHAVQGGMRIDAGDSLTFGYYAGPAAKITARAGGRTLTAGQATLRDGIQVFWLDATDVTDVTAYDADGRKLPIGNNGVGVG